MFQFITELQLETPQDSDESTCILHESNGSTKFVTELQLETPQDSDKSTLYTNQMGQLRASMAVLLQLFVQLTGLNEHNTGLLAPPTPPRSFREGTKQYRYMALLSLTAPKSEMQKIKSM